MRLPRLVTRLVVAAALHAAHHLAFRNLVPLSEQHSGGHDGHGGVAPSGGLGSSPSAFPRWEHDPSIVPYMGNLSCIFEVARYSVADGMVERAERCGRLRYVGAAEDARKPRPTVDGALDRLRDGSTIYIAGDSISRQHATDLMCRLEGEARLLDAEINASPSELDHRGPLAGYGLKGATFGQFGSNKTVRVVFESGNMGVSAPKKNMPLFKELLRKGKEGDVYVINGGLHVSEGWFSSFSRCCGDTSLRNAGSSGRGKALKPSLNSRSQILPLSLTISFFRSRTLGLSRTELLRGGHFRRKSTATHTGSSVTSASTPTPFAARSTGAAK